MNKRITFPGRKGMTLLEVLVALAVFSIMSTAAFIGLNSTLNVNSRVEAEQRIWKEMTFFFDRIERDIGSLVNRPIRTGDKTFIPALVGKSALVSESDANLVFTRIGEINRGGVSSTTRRVGYRFVDGRIEMLLWPVLDQTSGSGYKTYTLLESVDSFELSYMDETFSWNADWDQFETPRAVKVKLVLKSGENVERFFDLPL